MVTTIWPGMALSWKVDYCTSNFRSTLRWPSWQIWGQCNLPRHWPREMETASAASSAKICGDKKATYWESGIRGDSFQEIYLQTAMYRSFPQKLGPLKISNFSFLLGLVKQSEICLTSYFGHAELMWASVFGWPWWQHRHIWDAGMKLYQIIWWPDHPVVPLLHHDPSRYIQVGQKPRGKLVHVIFRIRRQSQPWFTRGTRREVPWDKALADKWQHRYPLVTSMERSTIVNGKLTISTGPLSANCWFTKGYTVDTNCNYLQLYIYSAFQYNNVKPWIISFTCVCPIEFNSRPEVGTTTSFKERWNHIFFDPKWISSIQTHIFTWKTCWLFLTFYTWFLPVVPHKAVAEVSK